jgi:3-oxoacyl-[acyl-carrier-protein] synthase III
MKAQIKTSQYYLPEFILTNQDLTVFFPEFSAEKILAKTGIQIRHTSASDESSSDMAVKAAEKLFSSGCVSKDQIDFLLFCTQTPDSLLPTNACMLQDRLGLSHVLGALDFNLGCSGFVYGLSLAKGLIESGQASNVLLLTADTYTQLIEATDKSVRTIFGDGAAATLISSVLSDREKISSVAYGTDGRGAKNLCVSDGYLRMNGPEIFEFTLDVVPKIIEQALQKAQLDFQDVELFVFHQANAYMLEHLRKKLQIPVERFWVAMDFCGNTVSSSIPIALREAANAGVLAKKQKVMLVGFGVGYSWAATIIDCSQFV